MDTRSLRLAAAPLLLSLFSPAQVPAQSTPPADPPQESFFAPPSSEPSRFSIGGWVKLPRRGIEQFCEFAAAVDKRLPDGQRFGVRRERLGRVEKIRQGLAHRHAA